jgi:hypothetical protein
MDVGAISTISCCILIMLQCTTINGIQYPETDKLVKGMISSGNISNDNVIDSTDSLGNNTFFGVSVCNAGYSNGTLSEIVHSIPADIQCNTERTVIFVFDETHVLDGWESIVILKSKAGFHLDQIITSGMGSVGNPTRFYALMSK